MSSSSFSAHSPSSKPLETDQLLQNPQEMPAISISEGQMPATTDPGEGTPAESNPTDAGQVQLPPDSFMRIPTEIRLRIYGYALFTPYNTPLIPKSELDQEERRTKRAILRANKEIYKEAVGVFYSQNIFEFEVDSSGQMRVNAAFHAHIRDIEKVILRFTYSVPRMGLDTIDTRLGRLLHMVHQRCPVLKTVVLYLKPEWDVGYETSYEAPSILRDEINLVKTNKVLRMLLPKVQEYLAIVAVGTADYFAEADTSLPLAPEVKWAGKNLESWLPAFGDPPIELLDDEVIRLWLFSKKGWSTMRWLKNNRCDFQERPRVEDGESEVEEPDEEWTEEPGADVCYENDEEIVHAEVEEGDVAGDGDDMV